MKIICIGLNYKQHILELHSEYPEKPVFFLKPDSCLLKNNKNFWLPNFSQDIQYEIEIVYKIGKLGKCIQKKFAYRYIESVGLGIDITARDLQNQCKEKRLPWEISKCFDGSAVVSNFIPIDEIADVNNLNFFLNVNDIRVQTGNSYDMIFNIFEIIEYVSQFMTLKTGDLIFTGTPRGVGKLAIGDKLIAQFENIELINMKVL
ncbi:MAG: fumarylacetoacetate hydrolase family protein [Bacteroidales bacterium]|jgi:2-keto-4-pentenoate hydratase/2-oxohepta-3-ene-1,7-dioic acid hydratase in catechol pathway|nr:fumarylacetoacetate hydrolase family protein [Bacteroidales bacterium]